MQRIIAIALLTVKAAFRFRVVLVLSVVLLGGVVALPLTIKDIGTAQGFSQLLLTYTLTLTTALLGFATIWLACGTLARDIEEAQMQMVVVKPVARWQIWLGKWLGIVLVDAMLLALAGVMIFGLVLYRAKKLPEKEQATLRNEIFVARGSAKEPIPDYKGDAERLLQERLKANPQAGADMNAMRQFARERIKAEYQIVRPDHLRMWTIDLGFAKNFLRDRPLFIRTKFNAAQPTGSGTYYGLWEIGVPASPRLHKAEMSMAQDSFYEFAIPPNLFDEKGVLTIKFINRNETALLFTLEEGMEVLYREGGFGLNFFRGLLIIFCWLSLLAALGLATSSFLAFPVAAFCSLGVLLVGLSSGTLNQVVEEGGIMGVNHETGVTDNPGIIDRLAVPVAKALLAVLNMARGFSPIDSLSSGRSITWGTLAMAFLQICVVMSGILAVIGISIFNKRELATAQSGH